MPISSQEARAVLRVLHAVAAADGAVDEEERRTLDVVGEQAGIEPGREQVVDVDAELRRITTPAAQTLTVRAALAISAIDGRCAPEEHALIARIHAAFGSKPGTEALIAAEEKWLSRMGAARTAIARATDDFLHALARHGAAEPSVYDRLLSELERRKRDTFAALLKPSAPPR